MKQARILIFAILVAPSLEKSIRKREKRQLFREQLLPNMGGKVPETAFQTDRLALNQLNSRGIYSSTGVYLEHRSSKDHAHHPDIKTMQVPIPEEDRYVAPQGRYHYRSRPTLDTTYVIREPVQVPIKANLAYHAFPVLPYHSLKLVGYYKARKGVQNRDSQKNDIEDVDDFVLQAKKEYEPYLKKLHEVDK